MIFERLDFYLDDSPRDGALNMAIDEVLVRSTRQPALRVYRWAAPSVSFGYFGRHREVAARWPGRALVRRWTGGGEVPHGEDFTYTLAVPRSDAFCGVGVRESYRTLHLALAALLPGATLSAVEAGDAPACFGRPVVADLLVAGKKIAGAAQRRGTFGLLHQGSVQGTPWPADLAQRFGAELAGDMIRCTLSATHLMDAQRLATAKYGSPSWLQRC